MMIPRTLVPDGARLSDEDAKATSRRRPSNLDERTLVPSSLPIVVLDGKSTIPSNLPLDSIAERVVVPRDVNVELVQRPDDSNLPVQPTDMDERMTVPQGAVLPAELEIPQNLPPVSEELVEPDIMSTGEVTLLPPETRGEAPREEKIKRAFGMLVYALLLLALFFEPQIFGPHIRTKEEDEIGRQQMTVLLPAGALDALKPSPPPAPHAPVNLDPKIIKKVAPPIEKPAIAPPVEQPKRDLPSAPVPQQNAAQPTPALSVPPPKVDVQPKLEVPVTPTPTQGLILPKQSLSPGGAIRDAERAQKPNSPAPGFGGGQLPAGSGGAGGRGHGSAGAGWQILSDTQGVDFNDYLMRVYYIVKRNWFAVMPASVELGERGQVSLIFKIMRDGSVPDSDPQLSSSSSKEPLDRAAVSSIRASNPFPQLPPAFTGPYLELRYTYFYNIDPPK
jgi:TonB family protein